MSKKKKIKGAMRLEAQARAHKTLYGEDWYEVSEYRRQARKILEKKRVNVRGEDVASEEKKILKKRLKEYETGRRRARKELVFIRVLEALRDNKSLAPEDERTKNNLRLLTELDYVRKDKITAKGRRLLESLK